ncbi:MAG: dihydroorotate dehydrogenase electron transfer subunit [Lactobacillales bacterium]|jgi:dihydroorotate dehydrogenase electron transfer subunit|nr:dihydroorotate dehydrogenase electron transfer subunit [Lactobacillales bacterium]
MCLQEKMGIVSQRELAPDIFEMKLSGKLVQKMKQAGQFLHIRVPREDLLLRRPISLAQIDQQAGICTIIYRVEGLGTEVFSKMKPGDSLDVLGPLGNGFDTSFVNRGSTVLILGGGIGVPPLYELSKQFVNRGVKVVHLLGFATSEVIFYEKEFRLLGETRISTDDGSYGVKGHVGTLLEELETENFLPDAVYACGSDGLLKMVDEKFAQHPAAFISMESRMACGIGACYACVCYEKGDVTQKRSRKICDQGPVFKIGEVVISDSSRL